MFQVDLTFPGIELAGAIADDPDVELLEKASRRNFTVIKRSSGKSMRPVSVMIGLRLE